MLLLHQTGTVKVGELVRYTITYTPAHDRILPAPPALHLRIKNTSAIALRAAFVHGPYALYVSAAPATHRTDARAASPRRDGVPEFEPNLKPGAAWTTRLSVPEDARRSAGSSAAAAAADDDDAHAPRSVAWVVEITSQVVFSASAAVHYELLLGRDEKSVSLGFGALAGKANPAAVPGQVRDHQLGRGGHAHHDAAQQKGVFSRAIALKVEDTAALWNSPKLPEWEDEGRERPTAREAGLPEEEKEKEGDRHANKKQKKVHLVVLTHGLHSNLGADMLYLKESIDAGTRKVKEDAKIRREKRREGEREKAEKAGESLNHHKAVRENGSGDTKAPAEPTEADTDESEDEEEVIVRGFSGNAVRTEKGIKYLGKRLAKYVLAMTYPDQPFRSVSRSAGESIKAAVTSDSPKGENELGEQSHAHSSIREEPYTEGKLAYKVTSISFIAHSLGGLTQTYAVAYIQKHSPNFFDKIKGINFICLASPFLGLSNENPLYVKFALDFGLVGRTGQDLGLTWRAPNIARTGWGALVSGMGEGAKNAADRPRDPRSKPLLRILPTGPAHVALKKFRNRTVYSNVVNDGIVPLRTSCLLFLDWQGLDRVEKARRENGLVGTMAGWGWAELTGQNATAAARQKWVEEAESMEVDGKEDTESDILARQGRGDVVPQPPPDATDDDVRSLNSFKMSQPLAVRTKDDELLSGDVTPVAGTANTKSPLDSLFDFFTPKGATKTTPEAPKQPKANDNPKQSKIFKRSQTVNFDDPNHKLDPKSSQRPKPARTTTSDEPPGSPAPPTTSFFEAAGDLLNPPLPPLSFLIDPASRPRTIFHDRVYHPEDIPPPPMKRQATASRPGRRASTFSTTTGTLSTESSSSASASSDAGGAPAAEIDSAAMKVEEKIARAYHRDLSWRKVLVRLEPDAHNNIIVRRKFANAYGWPVVAHLVDTHFSGRAVAALPDDDEGTQQRARDPREPPAPDGDETKRPERRGAVVRDPAPHQFLNPAQRREGAEDREDRDRVPGLPAPNAQGRAREKPLLLRVDSEQWSENDFLDSDGDSDFEGLAAAPALPRVRHRPQRQHQQQQQQQAPQLSPREPSGGWNWTEKIVGKGAAGPRGGKAPQVGAGHRHTESREFRVLVPEAADESESGEEAGGEVTPTNGEAAPVGRVHSGDATAVGMQCGLAAEQGGGGGVAERVARAGGKGAGGSASAS